MSGHTLRAALVRTAAYRGGSLRQLSQVIVRLPQLRQDSYTAWRRSQTAAALAYPEDFAEVVRHVITFADPDAAGRTWSVGDSAG
ncbi:MAG: hypothetical protein ACRDTH_06145 [Pseudonocardiaceae bacterium]